MRLRKNFSVMHRLSHRKASGVVDAACCVILWCGWGAAQAQDFVDAGRTDEESASEPEPRPGINIDDKRPDDQLTVELFGRPLTIGGEYEILLEYREDFNLDDDNERVHDQAFSVEFFYEVSDSISVFIDSTIFYSDDIDVDDGYPNRKAGLDRDQAWVLFEEVFDSNFDIQVGSQYFSEEREWWWDTTLDGVSVQYWGDLWEAEIGIVEQLAVVSTAEDHIDPEYKDVLKILGRAGREVFDTHFLEFFLVSQNDHSATEELGSIIVENLEDDSDAELLWLGVRSTGFWDLGEIGGLAYWVDTGYVRGKETIISFDDVGDDSGFLIAEDMETRKVRGWGLDMGLTLQTNWTLNPRFTLRYAFGSGDPDEDDGTNNAFRQTGLQENNDTFAGVNRFYYYGELLQPELSNLEIWTLSAGIPIIENSSLQVMYHRYEQHRPADFLRDVNIDMDPLGENKNIGEALDIVLGLEEWKHWEIEAVAAFFKAGDAFGESSGGTAAAFVLKVDFNF